jgi:hypothetical protein
MSIDLENDHLYTLLERLEETFPVPRRYDLSGGLSIYRSAVKDVDLIAVVRPGSNFEILCIETPRWASYGTLIDAFELHPIGLSLLRSTLVGFASLTPAE